MEDKQDWIVKEIEWDVRDPEGTLKNLQAFVEDPSNEGYKFDSMESVSNPSRFRVFMTLERGANKVAEDWKTTYGIVGKGHPDE